MKILILTDDFPPKNTGGASAVTFEMAKRLKELGNEVIVITTVQKKNMDSEINIEGIKVFQIYSSYNLRWKNWVSLYNLQTIKIVKKLVKEIKPDIVHAHNIHQYISYHSLKVAKKYAKAVFLTAHDAMLINYGKFFPKNGNDICKISVWEQMKEAKKRYNPFRNLIIRHYLKYVDKIFAVSHSLKKLLNVNGIKNVTTVYNGLDVDDWKSDPKKLEKFKNKHNLYNKKVLFFGGRLSGAKGGDQILKAVSLIKKDFKNIILLVVGEDNDYVKNMKELVHKLAIDENIIFMGWLSRKELITAYHSSDICVSPSLCFETFGMTNLETMACQKPVISSYLGGPKEVVVDEETGYLINSNEIEVLAEKILSLLKNPQKAKQFGEAGYQRIKNQFSLKKQIKETLKWYERYA